ncbi:heparan-alpha-glucosaminide N-acetyltransferase domain-containing protein [uncultured Winogradskyella sp.]|uniref:heparan-alpha-glucosaminide N-acetyltransferase domain-containing protein n=1 Tax=uncultured Winogradskyella sp. TaxID=395353 RepID=UPI0030DB04B8
MSTNRLYFIDAVRAFAILMMLQGHFIDSLMDVSYRDNSNIAFRCWEYLRGITAPTFFTISGLIFSYLLIKAKHTGTSQKRMRKGLLRGLMLIGIGYLLRVPLFQWLIGEFKTSFFVIDVLQCIGLSLILIVVIYRLTCKKTLLFSILMLLLGSLIFITEPLYRYLELEVIPLIFSNYLSKANGSIFTIIPWFGYVCFGGFIATLFYRYLERPRFKLATVSGFFIFGMLLIHKSSWLFMTFYYWLDLNLLKDVAYYNYLFTRLGNVLVIFSLFYLAETYIKQPLILKIGQKTLSIYVIHFIVIYGSITGIGLYQIIGKTLNPWQAIIGALLFLISVCFMSFYYVKTNAFLYSGIRKFIDKIKRI